MAVAEWCESPDSAFTVRDGLCIPRSWRTMCGGGCSTMSPLQCVLICCFTAARLIDRCCGLPVVVSAFAAWSTSLFLWMPT